VPPICRSGLRRERNKIARAGLEAAKKSKPAAIFYGGAAERIAMKF